MMTKVSQEQGREREETRDRVYSALSLSRTEHWEHKRKHRLTMTMLDLCTNDDQPNSMTTLLFRGSCSKHHEPDDMICGTVYLAKESDDEIIGCTMDDFIYILDRLFNT